MKNFQKISDNNDVVSLLIQLKSNPQLWNQNTLRTDHPDTPHKEVSDIWLRFDDLDHPDGVMDNHESVNYPAFWILSQAKQIAFNLMARVQGERLGRVLITKLPMGASIKPHVDGGSHAQYYDRFHVVLQSQAGVLFRAGDERAIMRTGEVWWFDNGQEHEVINNSADDRIHMIVDIRTSK
jgi:quercetin dioxygenase-like cupin family protein